MIQENIQDSEEILSEEEQRFVDIFLTLEKKLKKRTRWLIAIIIISGMAISILGGLLIEKNAQITVRNIAITTLKHERDSLLQRDSLISREKP